MDTAITAQPEPKPTTDRQGHPITYIAPTSGWVSLQLRSVWQYREVLYFLIWRDLKVRYKQTLLGASWAIIQPVVTMIVFSVFFGNLAKMPSDGIPYPIFSFAALLPWQFFANSLTKAANSLVGNANLIQKVYFPRLVVPLSGVVGSFPDFVLAFLVLVVLMLYYGIFPTLASLAWLPFFLLLATITSLGFGLWLAALNAQYRDVRYIVPFLVQVWLFATPVVYPASLLTEPWRTLYGLNPMVGVVEGFRWALLGSGNPPGPMVALSTLVAVGVLISGAFYFRRVERTLADVV